MSNIRVDCLSITDRIKSELINPNIDFLAKLLETDKNTIESIDSWQLNELIIDKDIHTVSFIMHEIKLNLLCYFTFNIDTNEFTTKIFWKGNEE